MNERSKTGLEILQAAILLGILADVLLRATPWGLNVLLFTGALAAAMSMLVLRRKNELWTRQTAALNGALVFFGAMFVWRDSIELKVLDTLAIVTILAILILPSLKIKVQQAGVFHYAVGFFWSGINAALAPLFLVFADIKWNNIPQTGWSKHLVAVLRGLAIAAPILFVFGVLFTAADAVFENFVQNTLSLDPESIIPHVLMISFFTWITAGYLRGALNESLLETEKETAGAAQTKPPVWSVTELKEEDPEKNENAPPVEEKKRRDWRAFDNSFLPAAFTLGAIETGIILGLINLLFLSFVVIQIPYLFGGFSLVQATPDFKLAEYARRGFGELVAVAALVLPILLLSHWLLRKDKAINHKIYGALAGVQIVLLFVIMLSAAQRLFLLTGNLGYGLTTARFYPMVFMILLALVFVWFAATVLRGAREQFAWGALWLTLFLLGTLHVLNPDEYIVRTNIRLMQQGRAYDSYYTGELSDDAIPAILESIPLMAGDQQQTTRHLLGYRFCEKQKETDFRSWNLSRWLAQNALEKDGGFIEPKNGCGYSEH